MIENLIANRREGFVARRVADIRKRCQSPMGALPFGVDVVARLEPPTRIAVGEDRAHSRGVPDLFPQSLDVSRFRVLAKDIDSDFPSDRRFAAFQQILDQGVSVTVHGDSSGLLLADILYSFINRSRNICAFQSQERANRGNQIWD